MAVGSISSTALAFDARSLDALRYQSKQDPQAALKQAAGQFEALFMQQLLKSMRDAMPRSGMFDGAGQQTWEGMLDQQLAQSMTGQPGGLAEIIARQLAPNLGAGTPNTAASPANGAAAADAQTDVQAGGGRPGPDVQAGWQWSGGVLQRTATGAMAASDRAGDTRPASTARFASTRPAAGKARTAQEEFVQRMWPHAHAAERATGVPAAFVVGQAALESGWGRQEMRHADGRNAHNLFGIKATGGWTGPTVDVTTTEYVDGKAVQSVEKFRAYGSYAEAFRDWATLLSKSARYADVLRNAQSAESFAQGLQRAGYATDPAYADKLESTIGRAVQLAQRIG